MDQLYKDNDRDLLKFTCHFSLTLHHRLLSPSSYTNRRPFITILKMIIYTTTPSPYPISIKTPTMTTIHHITLATLKKNSRSIKRNINKPSVTHPPSTAPVAHWYSSTLVTHGWRVAFKGGNYKKNSWAFYSINWQVHTLRRYVSFFFLYVFLSHPSISIKISMDVFFSSSFDLCDFFWLCYSYLARKKVVMDFFYVIHI